jgi:hypothetical protein
MELLAGKMLGFVLVLTRIGAFFASSPVFSWEAIPNKIKLALAILSAIFFSSLTSCPVTGEDITGAAVGLMIANEAIYGLALGFVATLIFATVKLSARIIERQMGLAMAQILDPLSGESGQPIGYAYGDDFHIAIFVRQRAPYIFNDHFQKLRSVSHRHDPQHRQTDRRGDCSQFDDAFVRPEDVRTDTGGFSAYDGYFGGLCASRA